MSEDPPPVPIPDMPTSQDLSLAKETRLTDRVTAQGAKARRVKSTDGQPGVADLTPLRELLAELVEEARKVKARERIAQALRQAADIIDPPGS